MEVLFSKRSKGYGTHVIVDMELVDAKSVSDYYEIVPGLGLLFNNDIEKPFRDGARYIVKAIIDNWSLIENKIGTPKVLYVASAVADMGDYQSIAFLGATIKWLNKYFELNIEIPNYTYDREQRSFEIE